MLSPFLERAAALGVDPDSGAARTLDSMLFARQLTHALILESEDAELLSSLAQLTAEAALCRCETPLAGGCDICRSYAEGKPIPDIIYVEGTGANGAISVAGIRELHGERSLSPLVADGVVCILKGAELMQKEAQNAFLKLFEEPPEAVRFILLCSSASKLLETIRSRGSVLRFEGRGGAKASTELCEFADKLLLSIASGSDAETMLLSAFFSYTGEKDERQKLRQELLALCERLELLLRDAIICSAGNPELSVSGSAASALLGKSIPFARLSAMLLELPELRGSIRTNAPIPLLSTAICVRLRQAAGK